MKRRKALLIIGAGTSMLTAGCVEFLTGEESLTFEATKGTVGRQAVQETGYQEQDVSTKTIARSFSAAGQTREVEVTNWVARYERTLELGSLGEQELGVFVVLSTPQVRVMEQTFNPVGEMSNRELLQELQSRYEGFAVGNRVATKLITILGNDVELEKFEGTATFQGQDIGLFIHIVTVAHEEDFVVPVAVYPKRLPGNEQKIFKLCRNIQH